MFTYQKVYSINKAGIVPTYDLTVKDNHSFVSEGMLVHNTSARDPAIQTLPAHTKWAKTLRKAFIAPDGYGILGVDYTEGELKIIADRANEKVMIQAYADGFSLHAVTAANILGIQLDEFMATKESDPKFFKEKRFGAKACIAKGQLVLTNKGLLAIEDVTCYHRVWDGLNWVSHDGIIYKGIREVITYEGLTGTPDHPIVTEEGRTVQIGTLASKMDGSKICVSEIGGYPVRVDQNNWGSNYQGKRASKGRRGLYLLQGDKTILCGQPIGKKEFNLQMPISQEIFLQSQDSQEARGEIRCNETKMRKPKRCELSQLWGSWYKEQIQFKREFYSVGIKEPTSQKLSKNRFGQDKQQWALRARESEVNITSGEFTEQKNQQMDYIQRDGSVASSYMAPIKTRLSRFYVFSKMDNKLTLARNTDYGYHKKRTFAPVYDILNAGQYNRFTVSGKLVFNSNFGFAYGMGAPGFMDYARNTYGVIYNLKQATQIRNDHFELYPGLLPWHDKEKDTARSLGYVRNPLGRVRHLPLIDSPDFEARGREERRSVNSPIQSCLNDLLFYAMALFKERYWEEYLGKVWMPTMMIHDSLYLYVKKNHIEEMAFNLKNTMETLPLEEKFGWKPKVPFTADCEIGYNLAEMKELVF